MVNTFQKILWNCTSLSSIIVTGGLAWYIKYHNIFMLIICFIIFITLFFYTSFFIHICEKRLSIVKFEFKEIKPNDGNIIGFILSNILPFASIIIEQHTVTICLLVSILFVLIMTSSNNPIPNLILLINGYHYYEASAENGISNYTLISKKEVRNNKKILRVIRINEYFLLDVEEIDNV